MSSSLLFAVLEATAVAAVLLSSAGAAPRARRLRSRLGIARQRRSRL
jgi:hypothetical protein